MEKCNFLYYIGRFDTFQIRFHLYLACIFTYALHLIYMYALSYCSSSFPIHDRPTSWVFIGLYEFRKRCKPHMDLIACSAVICITCEAYSVLFDNL